MCTCVGYLFLIYNFTRAAPCSACSFQFSTGKGGGWLTCTQVFLVLSPLSKCTDPLPEIQGVGGGGLLFCGCGLNVILSTYNTGTLILSTCNNTYQQTLFTVSVKPQAVHCFCFIHLIQMIRATLNHHSI